MKKVLLLHFVALLFIACQPKGPDRYTQNSPEIDIVKKHIANYNGHVYDASAYADTSKTYFNSRKNPMSPSDAMAYHKESDANYSSRGFEAEDQEYEMVLTDDGETWVNCWLNWKGTLSANGQEFEIPVHLTYRFAAGKIVRELGYWDPTEIVLTLQKIEAEAQGDHAESEED